jgi:hypothetical protein
MIHTKDGHTDDYRSHIQVDKTGRTAVGCRGDNTLTAAVVDGGLGPHICHRIESAGQVEVCSHLPPRLPGLIITMNDLSSYMRRIV